MIDPFANNSQSMQIGALIIENQEDKISIYGDIDISVSEQGLAQTEQLKELFGLIEDKLKNMSLNSSENTENSIEQKSINNPFL